MRHGRPEGALEPATSARDGQAGGVADVGAAAGSARRAVDHGTAVGEREPDQLALGGPAAAARTAALRLARSYAVSSASPVGSPAVSTGASAPSSDSPVSTVTSSVSKSTSAWCAGRPQ